MVSCQHGDQNRIDPRLLWPIGRCLLGLGMAVSLDGSGPYGNGQIGRGITQGIMGAGPLTPSAVLWNNEGQ